VDYEFFEEAMKAYIAQSGRSQAKTARMLGVEPDTFNKWVREVNRMPIHILHRFCELVYCKMLWPFIKRSVILGVQSQHHCC
jgi:DNA-binding transcriptional regulator YdaS (Cro superfamily)